MANRARCAGAALLSIALVVSGCGGSDGSDESVAAVDSDAVSKCVDATAPGWDDVVGKADGEGRVVLYTTTLPEINANLERAFETAYPAIDLQITRVVGEEINAALDAEQVTGTDGADVVSHVNYNWMLDHLTSGAFVEPVGPDSAGPQWKGTENLVHGVFQVSLLTGIGIAWRTDLVETAPTNYADLLKPEYSDGQIGIVNAEAQSLADLYAWMQDEFGSEYVPSLAAQQPRVYASAVPTLEALIAGEISVDAFASSIGVAAAKAKGAPIEFALPEPGWAPLNLSYMLAKSTRPNASQVLFNFMACSAGQEALAQNNVSVLEGIPGTIGSPDAVTAANLERMTEPGWIQEFYPRWADTFGR